MAKRKSKSGPKRGKKQAHSARIARRPKARPKAKSKSPKAKSKKRTAKRQTVKAKVAVKAKRSPGKAARLDRTRRVLEETMLTPPSSLDMKRRGSAVRTGRAEMAESALNHATMTPAITGGDVDADVENAYFSGDEAPGGDNPTPDQDIVDDIGKALGVTYQDAEELKAADKVTERDKHRWELDPASAEDYKERK
jgi:hypothetical protein